MVALIAGAYGPLAQRRALQLLASGHLLDGCEGRVGGAPCWAEPRAALADMCNGCLYAALHQPGELLTP